MNKHELLNEISKATKINKIYCSKVLNAFIELVKDGLNKGEQISINGFGKWKTKLILPRKIYQPIRNSYLQTKQKIIPIFQTSKNFNIKIV